MRRLNITSDVLDRLGFSEYWDEHGTFGTRTLTFDNGSQFTIVEQEDMVDEYEDIYISHHFYFCGSFSRPRLEPHITYYLFFLDEMYQCISQYYPHCLEEFVQRCHKAKMKTYLPNAENKALRIADISSSVNCDYRKVECSNNGQMVDGIWICSNHLGSDR